jgi:hypothetical protein
MAQYQALTDLYMADGTYITAGTVFDGPPNWKPPTHAVNCLDAEAVQVYHDQGPRFSDAEPWRQVYSNSNRWVGQPVPAATIWWVKVADQYVLHGMGSNLGPKPALPT